MLKIGGKKRADDLEEELDSTSAVSENMCYINGPINSDTIASAIGFIVNGNLKENIDFIVLFINSGGGNLTEGFALSNVIRSSLIPVVTVAIGECDSSALIIAMSGHKRLIAPDTSVLSHQYSCGVGLSKYADLKARQKDFEMTAKNVLRHYSKFTGLSEKDVRKYLVNDKDVFLSPEEAISFGLFDEIFTSFDQVLPDEVEVSSVDEEILVEGEPVAAE